MGADLRLILAIRSSKLGTFYRPRSFLAAAFTTARHLFMWSKSANQLEIGLKFLQVLL